MIFSQQITKCILNIFKYIFLLFRDLCFPGHVESSIQEHK